MATPNWGPGTSSAWYPVTFTADVVRGIAAESCPGLELSADAGTIAEAMNEAACELQLGLKGAAKPSEAEAWANRVEAACKTFLTAFGSPAFHAATRLELDADDLPRFTDMLAMARQVRTAAMRLSVASAQAKNATTVARPSAENAWLARMIAIFETCFGRHAGITKNADGERAGPCPRFIAEAARRLAADTSINEASSAWKTALQRFSTVKAVAGRMESLRNAIASASQ